MKKKVLLAIAIAIAIPAVVTAAALTITSQGQLSRMQPVATSTVLQNPNYSVGQAQPSQLGVGANAQPQ